MPTISEAGVAGYDFNSWFGVFAPARTHEAIIAKVHGDSRDVLALPDVQEKLRSQGAEPVGKGPQEFAELFKRDVTKLGQLISDIGLQVD